MIWCVYIIQAENGRLYTGITNSLKRRISQHLSGKGAKFFRISRPSFLVYVEKKRDRSSSSKRECELKKLSRIEKVSLIEEKGFRPLKITEKALYD